MSRQCMKQRRPLCVTFPIYRKESENSIYDRKGLKMKIGKDPPGQRNYDMEENRGRVLGRQSVMKKCWKELEKRGEQFETGRHTGLDNVLGRILLKKAWKGMVRWRKVKEGEDVNKYKKHKDRWWILLWKKVTAATRIWKRTENPGKAVVEKPW